MKSRNLVLAVIPFLLLNKDGGEVPSQPLPPSQQVNITTNIMPNVNARIDLTPGPYRLGDRVEATGVIVDPRYYFDKWYIAGRTSYMDSTHNPIVVELDNSIMYINLILAEK